MQQGLVCLICLLSCNTSDVNLDCAQVPFGRHLPAGATSARPQVT
jgi:hypothetical protein